MAERPQRLGRGAGGRGGWHFLSSLVDLAEFKMMMTDFIHCCLFVFGDRKLLILMVVVSCADDKARKNVTQNEPNGNQRCF